MLPPTILKHWPEFIPIELPLQTIFDNFSPSLKEKACGAKINHIHWVAKLDQEALEYLNQSIDIVVQAATIPSEHIPELTEIDVFLIELNSQSIPKELLCLLDKHMDKFLLFVCSYQNHYCLVGNYKKAQANNSNHAGFEITQTLSSAWLATDKLQVPLKGQSLREAYLYILEYIYTNPSKELAPLSLESSKTNTISAPAPGTDTKTIPSPQSHHSQDSLAETVSIEQVLEAKAQLSALTAQLQKCKQKQAKENQPNKKLALHKQAQKLQKQILELSQLIQTHTTHT